MTVNGQAYPVSLVLPNGSTLTGTLQFTDAGDQPGSGGGGSGLALTGWTEDTSNPAIVSTNGATNESSGVLVAGVASGRNATVAADGVTVYNADGSFVFEAGNGSDLTTAVVGFWGAQTPQPVVPLTVPTTQNVIDALVQLGLVSQAD